VTSGIVSTSSHGYFELVCPREIESNRDIFSTNTSGDHCRMTVNEGIETAARCVVVGVRRDDYRTSQ
jgi:hypothetical protein